MRVHLLVEGESEALFLRLWLPKFMPSLAFRVYPHQGKGRLPKSGARLERPIGEGLLDQLIAKLRAFGHALDPSTDRVLVLVDADKDDCRELKSRLLGALEACPRKPDVLFRIAVEELEAFYLGDRAALRRAFPRANLGRLKSYEQDSICDTAEFLQEVVRSRTVDKVGWAALMGRELGITWFGPAANRSPSFQQFCRGLSRLAGEPA